MALALVSDRSVSPEPAVSLQDAVINQLAPADFVGLSDETKNVIAKLVDVWAPSLVSEHASGKECKRLLSNLRMAIHDVLGCTTLMNDLELVNTPAAEARELRPFERKRIVRTLAKRPVRWVLSRLLELVGKTEQTLDLRTAGNRTPLARLWFAISLAITLRESNVHLSTHEDNVFVILLDMLIRLVTDDAKPGAKHLAAKAISHVESMIKQAHN